MHKVIDTPWNVTSHLTSLRLGGVETIFRYYNHQNSSRLPEKRVEKVEADAIAAEGLSLAVVFQQRGGAGGNISDLDAASGTSDARRAVDLAARIGQPAGSAIYFAVDHDFFRQPALNSITDYFAAASAEIGGDFRLGVYGSGTVGKTVRDAGYVDLIWLAAARGWSGTRAMLQTNQWALFQKWPPIDTPLPHDGNTLSPAWPDYGQFTPGGAAAAPPADGSASAPNTPVLMEVIARRGLNLRRGAGTQYSIEQTLPSGTIVHALGKQGDWVNVDVEGDGLADGHMHGDYLRTVIGGFPLALAVPVPPTPPTPPTPLALNTVLPTPYDVAMAELALDVREVPGSGNNPRIVMYHGTTNAWSGTDDDVAWCSSFVNYCVEQSGRTGTNSQRALEWENWGRDVSAESEEGDIVVFERVGKGGHVAFLVEDLGDHVSILGGNQSDRVKISVYPKNGDLGSTTYKLRSIRRG